MRQRGRGSWVNIYERPDGTRCQDKCGYQMRGNALRAADHKRQTRGWKLLYRVRVRYFLEPKT